MSYGEMEVKIKIWGQKEGQYVDIINGHEDQYIYIVTDVDERQIEIRIDDLKAALRKMTAK